ncbi:MAG TPA: nitroreductase family deazaflavin-dependent oxidoreductase [Anaerolineales bacterium]
MNLYHKLMDSFARTRVGGWLFLRLVSPMDQFLIPLTNGALNSCIGTEFYHNLVLLNSVGAKSGKKRSVAVLSTSFEGRFALIATAAGHKNHPGWYYNLKAHPKCSLLIRQKGMIPCVAREAEGDEREQAWVAANTLYDDLMAVYQSRVSRKIPIMILSPKN